jgi:diguanylate cyclase (GGDEF)-like protein
VIVQVLALFVLVGFVPLVESLSHTNAEVRRSESAAFTNARAVSQAAAALLEQILEDISGESRMAASLPTFWDGADEERDALLAAVAVANPTYNSVTFMTPDLVEHGISNHQPGKPRLDLSVRAYAREAVATGRLAVTTEPVTSLSNGVTTLPIAVPVQEPASGTRTGFLIVALKVARLPAIWDTLDLPAGSSVMLVDLRDGRRLAGTSNVVQINERLGDDDLERIRAGETAFRTASDGDRLRAWYPVGGTQWAAVVDFPSAVVLEPIYAEARRSGAVSFVIAVAGLFGLLVLWHRFGARLERLRAAAAHWAAGDLRHRARMGGRDELADLGSAFDQMADRLSASEHRLRHQAHYDELTGLPNRRLLLDRLGQALGRHRGRVAVLFVDLDNFKVVNDSLGHAVGDRLLVAVAERVRSCLRPGDTAARLGGDEFVILLGDLDCDSQAADVAAGVVEALRDPIGIDERKMYISGSVGVALSSSNQDRPEMLLRNADVALYAAKAEGKARYAVFDAQMNAAALERLEMESDLREALARGDLRVHYQPIVSLKDSRLVGAEALVRWEHPGRGMVSPSEFIRVAEETGLIVPLGQWVLEQACRQARDWQVRYPEYANLAISVNLSGRQLQHPALVEDIERAVRATGLKASSVQLEITESVTMRDAEATIRTLQALRGLGISLAIDDFGTGYSSLAYLKRFPVDTLKIDRAFVDGLGQDSHDTSIVRSIVALAQALDLSVTAEGVENPNQYEHLRYLGCHSGQGFLFSRAVSADDFECVLSSGVLPGSVWEAAA